MSRINNIETEMHQLMETFMISFQFLRSQNKKIENEEDQKKLQEFGEKLVEQTKKINDEVDNLSIYKLIGNQEMPEEDMLLDSNDNNRMDKQKLFLKKQDSQLEQIQRKRENKIQEYNQKKKKLEEINSKLRSSIEKCSQGFFEIDNFEQQQKQKDSAQVQQQQMNMQIQQDNTNNNMQQYDRQEQQGMDSQIAQQQQQQPQQQMEIEQQGGGMMDTANMLM